jgi:hypothetical protein
MNYQKAREEFAVRYYHWALEDAQREVREGFPFLKAIKDETSFRFLEIMETFQPKDQVLFALVLVKRAHPTAIEILGEYQTTEEKALINSYLNLMRVPAHAVLEIQQQIQLGNAQWANTRTLTANLKKELSNVFDTSPEKFPGQSWWYKTPIGGWRVRTMVGIGKFGHNILHYHHRLDVVNEMEWGGWISLLSWLGIGLTQWDLLTEPDIPTAAQTLAKLCKHFLQAMPSLLIDLDSDFK